MNSKHSHQLLSFTWLLSVLALLVTLYLSEILHWPVCHLCWYQRICLYPQVILLGMAVYRGRQDIVPYSIALLVVGFLFALYQTLEQHIPALQSIGVCGQGPSCSTIHMQLFGFLTLPMLSCIGFLVFIGLLWKLR